MDKTKTPENALKYINFIKEKKPGIKKIFLFGSYAKGTFHQDSDIDIAIVFDELADTFDMQVELMKLRRRFDTRIEPHPFSESDFTPANPLANEIIKYGYEIS